MGWLDKLLGRSKRTAGEALDDQSLRKEGVHQEAAGAADEHASQHEELAQEARQREATERAESENA